MQGDFDWLFLDCFNTLIDDFDATGDESGLGSLPALAVSAGFFPTEAGFVARYREIRGATAETGREMLLHDRLRRTLSTGHGPAAADRVERTVKAMLAHWETAYARSLRPSPGAAEMLAHWSGRKRLGVVSNFFLPHYPARYLERFGFAGRFEFILDSAAFGYKKPHPAIFSQALHLAGLNPGQAQRVLFIGDRPDLDILPAQACGLQVLHFDRAHTRPCSPATPPGVRSIRDWGEFR